MATTQWIAARYVKSVLSTETAQRNRMHLLERAGISPGSAEEGGCRVSTEQYTLLLQALWHLAPDEAFGFTRSRLKPGTFAMMCQAIVPCTRLEHALRRCARFYGLVTEDFRLVFQKVEGVGRLELHLDHPLSGDVSFFTEAFFAVLLRLMSWLVDQQIVPQHISLAYRATDSGYSFENKFPCPIRYEDSHSALVFSLSSLDQPLKREASDLRELLLKGPYGFLIDFREESNYRDRLKAFLTRDAENLSKDLETCAKELGTSPSTLRRRLRMEDENFHTLRDDLKRQRAIYYLQQTHKSIDAIATLMGYSEPSTFHRAFRKWTGETPRSFRQGIPRVSELTRNSSENSL